MSFPEVEMGVRIAAKEVKELREETGLPMMECKKALVEAEGDREKAKVILRKRGMAVVEEKAAHEAREGLIGGYIHFNGRVGVIVEVNCQTDFVARSEEFKAFVRDLSMHIAHENPLCLDSSGLDAETVEREKGIIAEQLKNVPEKARERAVQGKLRKEFFSRVCLLEQPFVKDNSKPIKRLLQELTSRAGEKIAIRRFVRYELGA